MNLIDRDALKQALQSIKITDVLPVFPQLSYAQKARIEIVIDKYSSVIQSAESVDAIPVVHGRWMSQSDLDWYGECSICGDVWHKSWINRKGALRYCPNCGAKMEGE